MNSYKLPFFQVLCSYKSLKLLFIILLVTTLYISRKNNNGQDEYLLMKSKRNFGKYTGYYYPPGGHLENDEDERTRNYLSGSGLFKKEIPGNPGPHR